MTYSRTGRILARYDPERGVTYSPQLFFSSGAVWRFSSEVGGNPMLSCTP